MDKNIKQIRKNFNRNSKILAKYFKHFYKIQDDDIDFFCYKSYQYDYLEPEEQEELEKIVLNNEEFFKFVNKCKINLELVKHYNLTEHFTKKELDNYSEMFNVLRDMEFSKQLKVTLMKKTMINCKINNQSYENENENNYEI